MNDIIIALAKAAIMVALNQPDNFDLEKALKEYPALKENAAVFVTINTQPNDQLRGCIGSLEAYRPLYKDIISNAQSAALRDPRFKPLTMEEYQHVTIEVDLLSKPAPLAYKDLEDLQKKIMPFKDGVILRHKGKHATYLPSVWEQLPTFNAFFSSLCQKANLNNNCLDEHPEISTYRVKVYKEK